MKVRYLLIFIFLYTVAAYNAGARNVERTLMNSTKLGPAAKKENSMNEKNYTANWQMTWNTEKPVIT